jgi:hypothetical protein
LTSDPVGLDVEVVPEKLISVSESVKVREVEEPEEFGVSGALDEVPDVAESVPPLLDVASVSLSLR